MGGGRGWVVVFGVGGGRRELKRKLKKNILLKMF